MILTQPLWEGDAPGTEGRKNEEEIVNQRIRKVHQPELTIHHPPLEFDTGTCILVCPGGGYNHLAINKEGHQIASWLNTLGIVACVLKYRLDRTEALEDAKRALRLIRAVKNPLMPNLRKIGVMGFSAGAHLITNLVLNSDNGDPQSDDRVEQASCHPDFMIPIYLSLKGLDIESNLPADAPPAFMVGATDDTTTPPEQALTLYTALVKKNIPAEIHLYERGGHGFGLGKNKGPVASWTTLCEAWMHQRKLLRLKK